MFEITGTWFGTLTIIPCSVRFLGNQHCQVMSTALDPEISEVLGTLLNMLR
jgi:hypothetical protein